MTKSQATVPPAAEPAPATENGAEGAPAVKETRAAGGLGYQPGLDGLRGLALLAIIVYHADVGHAPGAFLSVSTFFTLSGFLITAVMLHEHARKGSVSLGRFWARRFRRLLPASVVSIGLITVLAAAWLADSSQMARLRADSLSALGYVANWRFVVAGDSYGASFSSPSPLTHFWTLAIEEQLYMVLPLLVVGLLAAGRGSRRWLGIGLAAVVGASTLWSAALIQSGASIDRVYFGTDTRAAELAIGALLAVWWASRGGEVGDRAGRALRFTGPAVLAGVVVLWLVADLRSAGFYKGGLLAYSLLTCLLILGVLQSGGPLRRILSWRPLVWVGVVSYGAYLVHYPILLWLRQPGGLGPWARLSLGVVLTFLVAGASARWLERPFRLGQWVRGNRAWTAVPASMAACALLVVATVGVAPERGDRIDLAGAQDRFEERQDDLTGGGDGEPDPEDIARLEAIDSSRAPRIAPFGDSSALMTGLGLDYYGGDHPEVAIVEGGWARLGCGLLTDVVRRFRGELVEPSSDCEGYLEDWEQASRDEPADVALMQVGPWDVADHQLGGTGPFMHIGEDEALDRALRARLEEGVDLLTEHHGMVVLVLSPDIEAGRRDGRSPEESFPESDPERMAAFRAMLRDVASARDGVELVDMASWLETQDDRELRPDGIHFSEETATEVADWLGPKLADMHEQRTGSRETVVDADELPPASDDSGSAEAPGGSG